MIARKILLPAFGVLTWLLFIAVGFATLEHYAATAGTAQAPRPDAAKVIDAHRAPGRPLLVMAVHPRCPCTGASLAELGDLLAREGGSCDALILEYRPLQPKGDWPAPRSYHELGGRQVPTLADEGGRLASALGAHTSGHVIFVDAKGTLRYHGGITLARGHRGRAPAQDAILALLKGGVSSLETAPVYGCALAMPECQTGCNTGPTP